MILMHVHVHLIHILYSLLVLVHVLTCTVHVNSLYNKENVKHCWGRAHTSVYFGNLWKVILRKQNHTCTCMKNHHSTDKRGAPPQLLLCTCTCNTCNIHDHYYYYYNYYYCC